MERQEEGQIRRREKREIQIEAEAGGARDSRREREKKQEGKTEGGKEKRNERQTEWARFRRRGRQREGEIVASYQSSLLCFTV